ncbi:MAG: hypothetical protein QM497_01655, partial [Sulfurimonas sp.]
MKNIKKSTRKKGQKKMKNKATKIRENYERKLKKAISKSGAILISEPKGFYVVDEDDLSIL